MFLFRIIFVICFVLQLNFQLCFQQKPIDCNTRSQQKVDTNLGRIMTIGTYRKLPENIGHMRRYCQENMDMLVMVKNYTDQCLEHLPKQVSSVFIYTVEKNFFETICKKDSKQRRDLFRASPCANAGANEFVKCHQNLIDSMVALQSVKDDRIKIPFVCCEYYKVRACMVQSGKRIEECDNKKIDNILKFTDSLTDNVLDLICGGYQEGTDKCLRLGESPKRLSHQRRTKSFLFPVIEMLKNYPKIQG